MADSLPRFVERRQPAWDELDALIHRSRGPRSRLDAEGVRRLGRGYRQAVADLAVARRRFPGDPVTGRLEALVDRARPAVYGTVVERRSLVEFASRGYWRRVRERPVFLVVAALALLGPVLAVGAWSHADPEQGGRVAQVSPLSAGLADGETRDPDVDKESDAGVNTALSAEIFTNNVRVALMAFAGGLTGGVLTLVALVFNGLVLGLVGGLAISGGDGEALWRLVAPHGFLELSLIVVAGAAGLRTGWALLHPGHRTRVEALVAEGRAGVEMALGTAALLVPTGIVEGFVTPRGLTLPAALAVGIGLAAVYWALVVWRGAAPAGVTASPAP